MRPRASAQLGGPGMAVDVACELTQATIHHGRSDPDAQPEASSCTGEFITEIPLANLAIGTPIVIRAAFGSVTASPRFDGFITDVRLGWRDPDTVVGQFTAVTGLADMGRRIIGDAPWPSELDGARVARAIQLAGVRTNSTRNDPGVVAILARDVDAQPALDVATEAAVAGGGILWNDRAGQVQYADAEHRRNTPISVELTACDLPMSVEWDQNLDGLVNDVRIRYGLAPDGGEQPEVHAWNQPSIDARGLFGASLSTVIAGSADATKRADYIVARQAVPIWAFVGSALQLDTRFMPAALIEKLLGLEVHDLVHLTGLPESSPYTSALLWVEGWVEEISAFDWTLALLVSDYCRTAATPRWDDVDPGYTWDSMGALTWDQATCLAPVPPRGRWDDVPATVRWDGVPPTVTWDTWPDSWPPA